MAAVMFVSVRVSILWARVPKECRLKDPVFTQISFINIAITFLSASPPPNFGCPRKLPYTALAVGFILLAKA